MLTIFGILLGLRDKKLAFDYYRRRRDIMIKSPMYDWILEEGIEKEKIEIAQKMKIAGIDSKQISTLTGLSMNEINEL
jgi:predicted transposase YdaD